MYKCEHFIIEELVGPELASMLPEDVLWRMFPEDVLRGADWVKKEYSPHNPVTINNWKWDGAFTESGIRIPGDEFYSATSYHTHAMALDFKFDPRVITPAEIRVDLCTRNNVPYWKRVEAGTEGWLHLDVKPTHLPLGLVYEFNP